MKILSTIEECQAWRRSLGERESHGFTPTMGALHEGHLAHIRQLRPRVDHVIASVFVNPTQFAPGEDFEKYPRDLEGDAEKLREAGCDALFYPKADEIYPEGFNTYVTVGGVTDRYEGAMRPDHFRGVATVVCKLINIVAPDIMTLGEKDAQQLAVVRKMVSDLNLPTTIMAIPTVREDDGLAMSSRNAYLSSDERKESITLYQALSEGKEMIANGESIDAAEKRMRERISSQFTLDYCDIIDPSTFDRPVEEDGALLAIVAGKIGNTRLIDNMVLR